LGKKDRKITLKKPKVKPIWMSEKEFELLPNRLEVRITKIVKNNFSF
jgi:hypothetical protein